MELVATIGPGHPMFATLKAALPVPPPPSRLTLDAPSDHSHLANFYCDHFNALAEDGTHPDHDELCCADHELEDGDCTLYYDANAGRWKVDVGPAWEDDADGNVSMSVALAATGAAKAPPKPRTKNTPTGMPPNYSGAWKDKLGRTYWWQNGKRVKGPGKAKGATPAKVAAPAKAPAAPKRPTKEAAKATRAKVGNVSAKPLLAHKKPLSPAEMATAKRSFVALHRHHKELTLHRLHEMAKGVQADLAKAKGKAKTALNKQLAKIGHMAEMATAKGVTGKVTGKVTGATAKAKPAAKVPAAPKTVGKPKQAPSAPKADKPPLEMTKAEYDALPDSTAKVKWHNDVYDSLESQGKLPKVGDSWKLPDGRQATVHKAERMADGKMGFGLDIADHPLRLPGTSGGAGKKDKYAERSASDLVLQGWKPTAPQVEPIKTTKQAAKEPTNYAHALTIAADSVDKLRKPDVYRVVDSMQTQGDVDGMADYLHKNRPDLAGEIDEAVSDVYGERKYPSKVKSPAAKEAPKAEPAPTPKPEQSAKPLESKPSTPKAVVEQFVNFQEGKPGKYEISTNSGPLMVHGETFGVFGVHKAGNGGYTTTHIPTGIAILLGGTEQEARTAAILTAIHGDWNHEAADEIPKDTIRFGKTIRDAINKRDHAALAEVLSKHAGFTGVDPDSLGRLYHWVNGVRVPGPQEEKAGVEPAKAETPTPESPQATATPDMDKMVRAAQAYRYLATKEEPDDDHAARAHQKHATKSALDGWLQKQFNIDAATARAVSNRASEDPGFEVGDGAVRWTGKESEPAADEVKDLPWRNNESKPTPILPPPPDRLQSPTPSDYLQQGQKAKVGNLVRGVYDIGSAKAAFSGRVTGIEMEQSGYGPSAFGHAHIELDKPIDVHGERTSLRMMVGPDGKVDDDRFNLVPPTAKGKPPGLALADTLADKFKAGETVSAKDLFAAADAAFGGTRAQGKYGPSAAYDALEAGFNKSLVGKTDPTAILPDALKQAESLDAKIGQLPTQTNRSGNKDTMQQFSTPPHYAFAVAWAANLKPGETVLEPSAGTGCLATQAANAGASVYTNELDKGRAQYLRDLFGDDHVYVENAEQIGAILPKQGLPAPTTVIMNPPFSQTAGRMGNKKELMTGAKHIEEALQLLAPGGRLVAIVGRGMTMNSPTFKDWFGKIQSEYDFRANIGVNGAVYKKYGTQFDSRVLVIDKPAGPVLPPHAGYTGEAPDALGRIYHWVNGVRVPGPVVTGDAADVPDLMAQLEGVRNDRKRADQPAPGLPAGGGVVEQPEGAEHLDVPALGPDPELPEQGDAGTEQLPAGPEIGGGGTGEQAGGEGGGTVLPGLGDAPGRDGGEPGPGVGSPGGAVEQPGKGDAGGKNAKRSRKPPRRKSVQQPVFSAPELRPAEKLTVKAVEPETGKAKGELGDSLYEAYKPARLEIPGWKPHPSPLVESAAMAAVLPPAPTYQPHLSPDLVAFNKKLIITNPDGSKSQVTMGLSAAALETVVYAGQAHSQFLPAADGDVVNKAKFASPEGDVYELRHDKDNDKWYLDAGAKWHNFVSQQQAEDFLLKNNYTKADGSDIKPSGTVFRRGYFLGDGTGAGKGRQVAGVIADNVNQGRKKHVWVTQKQSLYEDAQRDIRDVGMDPNSLVHFDTIRKGVSPPQDGIAFITYDTLKGVPKDPAEKSNLQKLADWLGKDFDGVIAFDEAHTMANALDAKGSRGIKNASKRALAGVELQKLLPKARVLYVSATGATEVSNLAYADRLGIWGRGTPFADKHEFISQMNAGGVAAMEAVAQSLKATGSYAARSLSFDDGTPKGRVTYDRLTHHLSDEQHQIYDALADGWQTVLKNIDKALELSGGDQSKQAKSNARSQFWGAQQRFFNQVMTSMQTPSVIGGIEQDLKDGRSPVVQLVNTMESATDRAVAGREDDEDLEDIDVSPKEILQRYLEKSFPTARYETYLDESGNEQTRPVKDANGNLVEDPRAVALRDRMMEMVDALRIPESPLDMIISHFGQEVVAEATGRTQRLVHQIQDDGSRKRVLERRNTVAANAAEASAFQSGKKKIMVFSDAGGTGRSYHADLSKPNQSQRVHYLLQPGWRADNAVQGLGRTHRTNQAQAPTYRLVQIGELKAQKRFISTIARRLDQLGALTRGQRQTGSSGLFKAADNLESPEAKEALVRFFSDLGSGRIEGLSHSEVVDQLGLHTDENGQLEKLPPMNQFLNRLLSLRVDTQAKVFDAFDERLKQTVERAIKQGTLDTGVENYPARRIAKTTDKVVYTDPGSGATARHVVVKATRGTDKRKWEQNAEGELPLGYAINKQSGRVWAICKGGSSTDPRTGAVTNLYTLRGPASTQFKPTYEVGTDKYQMVEPEEAKKLWEKEYAAAPDTYETEEHFLTGALLPIWDRLPNAQTKIYRLRTDSGETMVGRYIPKKLLDDTLKKLGADAHKGEEDHTPSQVHAAVSEGGTAMFSNGWKLKPVRVQGERRIEIIGPNYINAAEIEQDGVIKERINYATRYFVPTGEEGVRVMERLMKGRPIVDVSEAEGGEPISSYQPEPATAPTASAIPSTPTPVKVEPKPTPTPATSKPANGYATYKGRQYKVLYAGQTKYGRRARLQFMDGSKDFWVDAKAAGLSMMPPPSRLRWTTPAHALPNLGLE